MVVCHWQIWIAVDAEMISHNGHQKPNIMDIMIVWFISKYMKLWRVGASKPSSSCSYIFLNHPCYTQPSLPSSSITALDSMPIKDNFLPQHLNNREADSTFTLFFSSNEIISINPVWSIIQLSSYNMILHLSMKIKNMGNTFNFAPYLTL